MGRIAAAWLADQAGACQPQEDDAEGENAEGEHMPQGADGDGEDAAGGSSVNVAEDMTDQVRLLMSDVGAVRGGASEPPAWIIGGDLNCTAAWLADQAGAYQPQEHDAEGENARGQYIQQCWSTADKPRQGDVALVQGMWAFECNVGIGKSFGREYMSDNHDMVVVAAVWPDDNSGTTELVAPRHAGRKERPLVPVPESSAKPAQPKGKPRWSAQDADSALGYMNPNSFHSCASRLTTDEKYRDQIHAAYKLLSGTAGTELVLAERIRLRPELFEGIFGKSLRALPNMPSKSSGRNLIRSASTSSVPAGPDSNL